MNSKAFVISFDAVLALLVVFAFLVASFSLISRVSDSGFNESFLQAFSFDSLKVLEASGKLQQAALENDSSGIDSFLNSLPYYYCARIDFFEQGSSVPSIIASKPNCRNVPSNAFLARRFFAVSINSEPVFYTAELKSWIAG